MNEPRPLPSAHTQPENLDPQDASNGATTRDASPPPVTSVPAMSSSEAHYGRFAVQCFHAKGGLGEVHIAIDEELRRKVALKRMQPRWVDDPAARRRFLTEANITARLEHPGIVPIYGLVQDEDGQPCYAMRFIAGQSLCEAVREFQSTTKQVPQRFRTMASRNLLQRFIRVCQTVAYAHSQGVIHRDLKPANVMLGPFGETLVVDWGLARALAGPTGEKPEQLPDEELQPSTTSTVPPASAEQLSTQAGQALGTLGYIAPEQAAGRWSEVGPCSDIYSLGATLYEMLTGQRPIRGSDYVSALQRAQAGEFPMPRQVTSDVPKALEAICLKAMARQPEARYAEATDLSADLEHWLADEPVSAYTEPWSLRAGRWLRRHRTLATSLAAAVVVATALLGLLVIRLNAEQRRTEQSLTFARTSLDNMTTLVVDDLLGRQSQLTEDHKKYLEQALAVYDRFAQETGDDERTRNGVAGAYLRVGDIRQRLGEYQEAETAYQQAIALFERLASDFPAADAHQRNVANTLTNLGVLFQRRGRHPEAETAHRRAIAWLEPAASRPGAVPKCRQELAHSYVNLASPLQSQGKFAEAEQATRQAWALEEQLLTEFPGEPGYRRDFAATGNNLAVLLNVLGKRADAESVYRRVVDIQEKLGADFPAVAEYRQQLARTHNNLGILLQALRRFADADAAYHRAIELREQLAADFPSVPENRQNLAHSHHNLGVSLQAQEQFANAEAPLRAARGIRAKLCADFPKVPEYRRDLATSYNNLGLLLRAQRKTADAEAELQRAIAVNAQLAAEYPKIPEFRQNQAHNYFNLALVLVDAGRHADADAALRKADEFLAQLAADAPKVQAYRMELAQTDYRLGLLLRDHDNPSEAETVLGKALALYEKLADEAPDMALFRQEVGGLCINLGALCLRQGRTTDALAWYTKSIGRLELIVAQQPNLVLERQYLTSSFSGRAQALVALGRNKDALADWDRALQLSDKPAEQISFRLGRALALGRNGDHAKAFEEVNALADTKDARGEMLYELARVCALASAAITTDVKLQDEYASRAVELLRQAIAKGYKDTARLKQDTDLDSLRQREDFQTLVKALAPAASLKWPLRSRTNGDGWSF